MPDAEADAVPKPDPASPEYRIQVQNHIQGLISGTQPRDPHFSKVSTGRLILEGVVENVRLYRLYKEGKAKEAREEERRRKKRMSKHGRSGTGGSGDGDRRHRDGKGERRHRHGDGSGRRRHGARDGSRERHGERHGEEKGRRRHRSRERHGETGSNDNPQHLIPGGAGLAGASPAPTLHPHPKSGDSPPSPSPRRKNTPKPWPPHYQMGPDGLTPFGSLPSKVAGIGLAAHVLNTYRHIKAEHDAGQRSRSAIEKAVDGWRGKGGGGEMLREVERLRKKDQGRGDEGRHRRRDGSRSPGDNRRLHKRHKSPRQADDEPRPERRRVRKCEISTERPRSVKFDKDLPCKPTTPYAQREDFPQEPRAPTPPPHTPHSESYDQPDIQVREPTPPAQSRSASPPWPPTPSNFVPPGSGSSSPPYSATPNARDSSKSPITRMPPSTPTPAPVSPSPSPPCPATPHARDNSKSPVTPMSSSTPTPATIPAPIPPPRPANRPPPPPPPKASPAHGALLDEIIGGAFNLRKTPKPEDEEAYSESPHSRDVEERESRQAWDDAGEDDENETERRRGLREALEARMRKKAMGDEESTGKNAVRKGDGDGQLAGEESSNGYVALRSGESSDIPNWCWGDVTTGKKS